MTLSSLSPQRGEGGAPRSGEPGEGASMHQQESRRPLTRHSRFARMSTSPRTRGEVKKPKPLELESNDTHAQSSHFRRPVCRRRADLQGSRHRGGFPAGARQGQGQTCRDHRQLRRPCHPLRDQSDRQDPRGGQRSESDRARGDRCRQRRYSGGDRARHHRHEYAFRQFNHDRGTRRFADAGFGAANPGSRRFDARRQVGKEQVHGRGDLRQDTGRHRLRQYRLDRRRSRARTEDESRRL